VPGLLEKKKQQLRQALVTAAMSLFARDGFEETTVDQVAEAAGVSRRTVFRYFLTKDALVTEPMEVYRAHFIELLAELPPEADSFERVAHACLGSARAMGVERELLLKRRAIVMASPTLSAKERSLDESWEDALAAALGSEGGAGKHQSRIVAAAVFAAMRTTLSQWLDAGAQGSLEALAEEGLVLLRPLFRKSQSYCCHCGYQ